jgi:hypothetical protein
MRTTTERHSKVTLKDTIEKPRDCYPKRKSNKRNGNLIMMTLGPDQPNLMRYRTDR